MAFESSEISIEPATGVSVCECFQDLGHCKTIMNLFSISLEEVRVLSTDGFKSGSNR